MGFGTYTHTHTHIYIYKGNFFKEESMSIFLFYLDYYNYFIYLFERRDRDGTSEQARETVSNLVVSFLSCTSFRSDLVVSNSSSSFFLLSCVCLCACLNKYDVVCVWVCVIR